ncbi:MAG: polysaccharide export protein [Pontiellaceae bacterium]|jgi:polysaccharide export outer membrane protein|nr:polysaccharide export protein [Pontiellaceae bacterium]
MTFSKYKRMFIRTVHFIAPVVTGIPLVLGVAGCQSGFYSSAPDRSPESFWTIANEIVPTNGAAIPVSAGNGTADFSHHSSRLRSGMILNISVLVAGKPAITEPAKRISETGDITLPILGNVKTEGLTLKSLAEALTKNYREYFVDPQIVVDFAQGETSAGIYPWGYVTVLGRVKSPGRVEIPATRDLTVSRAIQQAGGLNTSAQDAAIRVTRRTASGQTETVEINLREVGTHGRIGEDILLLPNDVVFVPELRF